MEYPRLILMTYFEERDGCQRSQSQSTNFLMPLDKYKMRLQFRNTLDNMSSSELGSEVGL